MTATREVMDGFLDWELADNAVLFHWKCTVFSENTAALLDSSQFKNSP